MMSAKNLRDSILQMAVEGKLVEQRKEEGTAEDLLASIREQRAQLVREKKAKPVKGGESVIWRDDDGHWFERRGKGEAVCIDDEIPFDIPDSWCWARLSMVTEYIQRGKSPKYSNIKKLPVVAQKCNQWSGFSIEKAKFADPETITAYRSERYLQDGDLLWNSTGLGTLGRMAIYRSALNPYGVAVADSHVTVIRSASDWMTYKYLFSYFAGPSVQLVVEAKASGSTKQKELSLSTIMDYLVPIPPLAEQRRIAAKIDELMPLIDEYGNAQERREQLDRELPIRLRKSILQAAVEGKLTEQSDDDEPASVLLAGIREKRAQLVHEGKAKPVKGGESIIYRDDAGHWFERRGKSDPVCIDEEIPFDIPDSWCWARLESVCNFGTCANIEYEEVPEGTWNLDLEDLEKNTGFILQKKRKRVDEKGSTKHVFKAGEVLYGKLRPYLNKVAIADEDGVCTSEILPLQIEGIGTRYVQLFLMSPHFVAFANSHVSGTKMPRLKVADGRQCLMPVPPLGEQDRLVEKIHSLFSTELKL